jgi:hypothetical protein
VTIDAEISQVTRAQYGLLARWQLPGVGDEAFRHRVRNGHLTRLRREIYIIQGAPSMWEQSVLGAVLASGPGAVASHETAAVLHDLPIVERGVIEVSTPRPRRARHSGVRVHRTIAFLELEHTTRRAIPVTTVARTLVDLSGRFAVSQLGRMTDHALRKSKLRLDDLRRCVAALPPAPGRRPKRIEAVLARRLPGYEPGDSGLEMRFLRALVAGGLPEPVQQHAVKVGGRSYRLDFAYPEQHLAIEIDGWDVHRTRSAFDGDRARSNDLEVAGWHVLRFTSATTDEEAVSAITSALASLGRKPCL